MKKKHPTLSFECFVEEVYKRSFLARLIGPEEEGGLFGKEYSAEISTRRVPRKDRAKIRQEGTIFHLTFEKGKKPVFFFPPPQTEEEVQRQREEAAKWLEEVRSLFKDD